jgi:hypothetical protein
MGPATPREVYEALVKGGYLYLRRPLNEIAADPATMPGQPYTESDR